MDMRLAEAVRSVRAISVEESERYSVSSLVKELLIREAWLGDTSCVLPIDKYGLVDLWSISHCRMASTTPAALMEAADELGVRTEVRNGCIEVFLTP